VSKPLKYNSEGVPTIDGLDLWPYLSGMVAHSPRSEIIFKEFKWQAGHYASAFIQWPYKYITSNGIVSLFGLGCAGVTGLLDTGMPTNQRAFAQKDSECDGERVVPPNLEEELNFIREASEDEGVGFSDDDANAIGRSTGICKTPDDMDCTLGCLFNIEDDPSETSNLIVSLSEKATEMKIKMKRAVFRRHQRTAEVGLAHAESRALLQETCAATSEKYADQTFVAPYWNQSDIVSWVVVPRKP
jgi:hypothetical protein